MKISEEEKLKRLLESQYADVMPPQRLKANIMGMIEFIKTLKELALLYTEVPFHLLSQNKTEGGEL